MMMMIVRQIRKLLETFLKSKEATIIHKRGYWLCILAVKTLAEANITESDSVLNFKVFWIFVKATPIIRLSNDY